MLRIVFTVALTLAVALVAGFALLELEIAFHPEYVDRAFGFAVLGVFDTAIYAWLYATAVGFAVSRSFRISGWRRLTGAVSLLALPPLLMAGLQEYRSDGSIENAVEFVAVVLLVPFVVSLVVAIVGMAPNKSLERTRGR
jgi:hypothetical protein